MTFFIKYVPKECQTGVPLAGVPFDGKSGGAGKKGAFEKIFCVVVSFVKSAEPRRSLVEQGSSNTHKMVQNKLKSSGPAL